MFAGSGGQLLWAGAVWKAPSGPIVPAVGGVRRDHVEQVSSHPRWWDWKILSYHRTDAGLEMATQGWPGYETWEDMSRTGIIFPLSLACSAFQLSPEGQPPCPENGCSHATSVFPDPSTEQWLGVSQNSAGTGKAPCQRDPGPVSPAWLCITALACPSSVGPFRKLPAADVGSRKHQAGIRTPCPAPRLPALPAQADGFCRTLRMLERGYFGPRGRLNSRRIPGSKKKPTNPKACQSPRRWKRCSSSVPMARSPPTATPARPPAHPPLSQHQDPSHPLTLQPAQAACPGCPGGRAVPLCHLNSSSAPSKG